jgi:hypothetical protein
LPTGWLIWRFIGTLTGFAALKNEWANFGQVAQRFPARAFRLAPVYRLFNLAHHEQK